LLSPGGPYAERQACWRSLSLCSGPYAKTTQALGRFERQDHTFGRLRNRPKEHVRAITLVMAGFPTIYLESTTYKVQPPRQRATLPCPQRAFEGGPRHPDGILSEHDALVTCDARVAP